jgi:DNA polymerase III epsilon subunit-like protein
MSAYYLAFDVESGGLNPTTSDLLTIYLAIVDENFKVVEELDLKLKPDGGRLPVAEAGALKVNGIDLHKHLADPETITYSEAKEKIVVLLKKYLKKRGKYSNITPLGQNVDFDIRFLQHHVLCPEEYNKYIHYGKMDTKMISDFFKACSWFPKDVGNLGSIAKHLNVTLSNAHNARADTLACVEVYKKMVELMESKKNGGGQSVDLIVLLEAE